MVAVEKGGLISTHQPANYCHRGGTIAFDKAGRLVINLGDGGGLAFAQDAGSLLGKLLRIDPATGGFPADPQRNFSIPAANPFAPGGGQPEIGAMGLRNPFRGSFDPIIRDYFFGDGVQDLIEEIDRTPPPEFRLVAPGRLAGLSERRGRSLLPPAGHRIRPRRRARAGQHRHRRRRLSRTGRGPCKASTSSGISPAALSGRCPLLA